MIDALHWVLLIDSADFSCQHHAHPGPSTVSHQHHHHHHHALLCSSTIFCAEPGKNNSWQYESAWSLLLFVYFQLVCSIFIRAPRQSVCARRAHGWMWKEGFVTCQLSPCADVNTCDRKKTEASTLCHCRRRQSGRRVIRSAVGRFIISYDWFWFLCPKATVIFFSHALFHYGRC